MFRLSRFGISFAFRFSGSFTLGFSSGFRFGLAPGFLGSFTFRRCFCVGFTLFSSGFCLSLAFGLFCCLAPFLRPMLFVSFLPGFFRCFASFFNLALCFSFAAGFFCRLTPFLGSTLFLSFLLRFFCRFLPGFFLCFTPFFNLALCFSFPTGFFFVALFLSFLLRLFRRFPTGFFFLALFFGLSTNFRLALRLFGLAFRFFCTLATHFRLPTLLGFLGGLRQLGLAFRFCALKLTFLFSQCFQFLTNRDFIHDFRRDRFSLHRELMRRASQIQVKDQQRPNNDMQDRGKNGGDNILLA